MMMDIASSQQYKNLVLFSEIWLTVIEWIGIDLIDTDSVNAPFVLSHLPTSRNLHILGFTTSTECA